MLKYIDSQKFMWAYLKDKREYFISEEYFNRLFDFESNKQHKRITVADQDCPDENSLDWCLITICLCWFKNEDFKNSVARVNFRLKHNYRTLSSYYGLKHHLMLAT